MLTFNPVKLTVKIIHCSQGINTVQVGSIETRGPTDAHCIELSNPLIYLSGQVILRLALASLDELGSKAFLPASAGRWSFSSSLAKETLG